MQNYAGDFKTGATVNIFFTTNAAAGGAVAPLSAFEAADVILYKGSSATQRTSQAGWTMVSPFDSIVGLHCLSIDLSDNTDSGFYAAGNDYTAVLSPDTETVDGQTVVAVIGTFSIENRVLNIGKQSTVAIPNIALDATGGLHSPVVRGGTAQATGNTTSAIKLDSGASSQSDAYKGMLVRILSGTSAGSIGLVQSYNGTSKVAGISGTWKFGAPDNTSVFVVLDYGLSLLWDEVVTGAVHNVQNSAATFLRNASGGGAVAIRTGTAQAGSTSTTIKLDSGASATNNVYNNATVVLTGGTGLGQTRTIIAYNGATKVATVAGSWVTTPTNTTTFAIYAAPTSLVSDQGTAQAGAASSLTLAATASATDNIYNGSFLTLTGGTDAGETHVITAYNGTTKVATVDTSWSVTPDATTTYAVIPSGAAATDSAPAPPTSADIVSTLMGTIIPATDLSAVTAPTAADAYAAALSQGAGVWDITGTTLTLKNLDGTTFRTFTLGNFVATPATVPTTRT